MMQLKSQLLIFTIFTIYPSAHKRYPTNASTAKLNSTAPSTESNKSILVSQNLA